MLLLALNELEEEERWDGEGDEAAGERAPEAEKPVLRRRAWARIDPSDLSSRMECNYV